MNNDNGFIRTRLPETIGGRGLRGYRKREKAWDGSCDCGVPTFAVPNICFFSFV